MEEKEEKEESSSSSLKLSAEGTEHFRTPNEGSAFNLQSSSLQDVRERSHALDKSDVEKMHNPTVISMISGCDRKTGMLLLAFVACSTLIREKSDAMVRRGDRSAMRIRLFLGCFLHLRV